MLSRCEQAARNEGLEDRLTFLRTDLLEYEPETDFDVSYGIGLFDYISDPLPVLRKMRQVTSDKTILAFPRFWTWRAPVRKVRLAVKGCPVYFYTKRKIDRLLNEAGFGGVRVVALAPDSQAKGPGLFVATARKPMQPREHEGTKQP